MLFNSIEYLIFLPLTFLLYWFAFRKSLRLQNLFVVIASYIFYCWWDWRFAILIAFTSLCSFVSGRLVGNFAQKSVSAKWIKMVTIANVVVNLGILCVFKYYDFFVESFAQLFDFQSDKFLLNLLLPVGISFYTFQALSYTIDVYKKKIEPTKDVVAFFAYVSFFPQLVAGPIERATNLLPQFEKPRTFDYAQAADGMRRILWGLFKKVVIADNCADYVNEVFNNYGNYSGSSLLIAGVLFAFQIYGDFSGYSDIAIGSAKLFGINLKDNFRNPYFSRDIAEFWKRWHISLNKWFVDYVYIPLGGSRVSKAKIVRNIFVIFLLSGLWHGANWTYVTWGAYHATLFLPLILLDKNKRFRDVVAADRALPSWQEMARMLLTFTLVVFGWIIFRADNIAVAGEIFRKIFSAGLFTAPYAWNDYKIPTLAAICICILVEWMNRKQLHGFDIQRVKKEWLRVVMYYAVFIMIVLFSGKNVTFIYFQF